MSIFKEVFNMSIADGFSHSPIAEEEGILHRDGWASPYVLWLLNEVRPKLEQIACAKGLPYGNNEFVEDMARLRARKWARISIQDIASIPQSLHSDVTFEENVIARDGFGNQFILDLLNLTLHAEKLIRLGTKVSPRLR